MFGAIERMPILIFMEFWKNLEPGNLTAEVNGEKHIEEWVELNIDRRYQISSFGRLKRLRYQTKIKGNWVPERVLKAHRNDKGYLKIGIGEKNHAVARLVAFHFHPNPHNYPEVNHIDFNKCNNAKWNLEWATPQSNMDHYYASDRVVRSCVRCKISESEVKYIRQNIMHLGVEILAQKFKVANGTIYMVGTGKARKTVKGEVLFEKLGTVKPIIDLNTGVFYESAKELADLLGWKPKEIRRRLNGERANYTSYRYA